MKKTLIIAALISFISLKVNAEVNFDDKIQAQNIFENANKYYKEKKYEKALENYKIIEHIDNAYIFYNLGNTYLKLGQNGYALSNYLKAKQLLPRENKIDKNIKYLDEKLNREEKSIDIFYKIFKVFSFTELIIISSLIWILIFIYLLIKRFSSNKLKIYTNITNFVLIPIFTYFLISLIFKLYDFEQNKAIVITQEAEVKISNNNDDITLFKLKEGQEVKIIEQIDNWFKINFEDNKGWISKNSINKISIL